MSFAYDAGGLRTGKTVNGTTYRYFYMDSKLMRLSWGSNIIDFFYDANGTPYSMKYNGALYYYVTNLQGDIMRIVNTSGTVVASYDYDPYGKVISATGTLANINPLRYRGYVYDTETGFYYLQSRYYDPAICRFINADNLASTGQGILGNNMFAYCGNNPVMREDRGGNFWLVSVAARVGVALLTRYVGDVIENLLEGKTGRDIFDRRSTTGEYIAAAVTALIPGTGFEGAIIRNIVAEGITIVEDLISGNDVNVVDSLIKIAAGTYLDTKFEQYADKALDFISSKIPSNYSSYAHAVRKSNPSLTRDQIYRSMQRSIRFNRVASKAVSFGFDIVRSILPY